MNVKSKHGIHHSILVLVWVCSMSACNLFEVAPAKPWVFVSMPDFLNVDCAYPQRGWEESLSYILQAIKSEDPDFLMVAGDLVMGHWDGLGENDQDTIFKYAAKYYGAWKARMANHGLQYYTAIGDHEVGDNPWRDEKKLTAVRNYKEAFSKHLQMPDNGPAHMVGTAFWWRHKNVLFISVDVFEEGPGKQGLIRAGVTGEQLSWLRVVLQQNHDADHKIVMGHTPVLGPVRKWSSSGLLIEEGRESAFWQVMKDNQVDLYLCGEVHAITCTGKDSIMQVAHGGLIGYNTRTNYLVAKVYVDKIECELKEIEMRPQGEHLWQTKRNRPLEEVIITPENRNRGFYTVGKFTIDKSDGKRWQNRQGYFEERYGTSNEVAVPIFRKNNPRGLPSEFPHIILTDGE